MIQQHPLVKIQKGRLPCGLVFVSGLIYLKIKHHEVKINRRKSKPWLNSDRLKLSRVMTDDIEWHSHWLTKTEKTYFSEWMSQWFCDILFLLRSDARFVCESRGVHSQSEPGGRCSCFTHFWTKHSFPFWWRLHGLSRICNVHWFAKGLLNKHILLRAFLSNKKAPFCQTR